MYVSSYPFRHRISENQQHRETGDPAVGEIQNCMETVVNEQQFFLLRLSFRFTSINSLVTSFPAQYFTENFLFTYKINIALHRAHDDIDQRRKFIRFSLKINFMLPIWLHKLNWLHRQKIKYWYVFRCVRINFSIHRQIQFLSILHWNYFASGNLCVDKFCFHGKIIFRQKYKQIKRNGKFKILRIIGIATVSVAQVFGFIKVSSVQGHIDISTICHAGQISVSMCNIWKKSFASSHECKQMKRFLFSLCIFLVCVESANVRIIFHKATNGSRMVSKDILFFFLVFWHKINNRITNKLRFCANRRKKNNSGTTKYCVVFKSEMLTT